MKESLSNNQLIIVLSEHPVFGMLLLPYIAERISEDGELCLVEQAFHLSAKALLQLTDAEQNAIKLASHYTEKYLMTVYSKDKTIPKFLKRLAEDQERLKNIRLFIEKKLLEMLELIRSNNLPFYQKQNGSKTLYAHHACLLHRKDTEAQFSFELGQHTFSYQLKCFNERKEVPLTQLKPAAILTTNPATLLLGMEVHTFRDMEATRLMPFTKKTSISVDIAHVDKYIDNILIPIARYHSIVTRGFSLKEEKRTCECLLYIEETIYSTPLLRLNFRYGDQIFTSHETEGIKRYIFKENSEDGVDIHYFQRDNHAEEKAIQSLLSIGLESVSDSHFKLSAQAMESSITEWISNHRSLLQESFILTSSLQNAPYCLEDIHIEQSFKDGPDWFELHITVVIGNLRIPFSRFRKNILEEKREFTLPDGQIILLPEEWFSKYANLMEVGISKEKAICLKRPYVGLVHSILEENHSPNVSSLLIQQDYPVPPGIKVQLRPYQLKGYKWMMNLYEQNFNGCLADDMGLGKTLQTLTLLQQIYHTSNPENKCKERNKLSTEKLKEKNYGVNNWGSISESSAFRTDESGQFELFGDLTDNNTLNTIIISPSAKNIIRKAATLIVVPTSLLHNWKRETTRFTSLSLTEYNSNTLLNERHPERFFNRFNLIFISYGMMRSKIEILRQYHFEYIILDESQNIKNSDSLTFRSAIQLQSNHRLILTGTPIENSLKDLWAQFHFLQPELLGNEHAFTKRYITPVKQGDKRMEIRLRQLINPLILRRSKNEVAPELPSLTEEIIFCDMTDKQNEIYQQEKNSLRNTLLKLNSDRSQHRQQQLTVLNGISRLRQLSCHPQMIFDDFIECSGKSEQIIDTFETLRSEGHKVLIFSSFVKHLNIIATEFNKRGWQYALLTGSSSNRPEEIARFSESKEIQAFLISLKAGGVGLNLTEADYVFIIDPWWNPAAEAQAIARAHRIGQNKQVIAYRFITQGSIEEKIIQLQEEKRKLAETFIQENKSSPDLTDQEWIRLLE